MTTEAPARGVGVLLRDWRRRRRLSQLDLALRAEVSARHISFVETGRSTPSRELLLHLAEHLDVPLRERNVLLLAAGYAPTFPETPLDDAAMSPVREALDNVLRGHEPFPAVVVDGGWNLISANRPAMTLLAGGVAPELLAPPANTLRIVLHPDGLAPRIANLAEYSSHLLTRLHRQAILADDPALSDLYDELRGYPGVHAPPSAAAEPSELLFVPLRLLGPDGAELTFFSTLSTFGTARDITLAELAVESHFPADRATDAALRALFDEAAARA
jgi:transcriptional regulator with XRE-family HTH domain